MLAESVQTIRVYVVPTLAEGKSGFASRSVKNGRNRVPAVSLLPLCGGSTDTRVCSLHHHLYLSPRDLL
jgi:hypothetical protein